MMTNLAGLRGEFASRALEPETRFLLRAADALLLIDRAIEAGATLAGVEAFASREGWAGPAQYDLSTDRAETNLSHQEFVEFTRNVLCKGEASDMLFEVVFEGEHD
jgi:hypothetical protein